MSDDNMSLKMHIDTTYNGTGASAAAKDVETLDTKQAKANKTVNASKAAGINASAGFGAAGAAAGAAANGGIGSLSSAMGQMLGQMEGMAAFAGTGGLLLGAFAAWKSALDAVKEAHQQLQNNIDGITIGNLQSKNKNLKDSYKEITDQLTAASAAITRFYSEQEAGSNAAKRYDMAMIDLEDAQKRAALDPADTFGAQRLTVETAKKKAYTEKEYERNRLESQASEIGQQKTVAETKHQENKANYNEVDQAITSVSIAINDIMTRAQADASKAWTAKGAKNVWKEAGDKMKDLEKELESLKTQFSDAAKSLKESEADLRSIDTAASINYRDTETNKLTYGIQQNTATANSAGINYSEKTKNEQARTTANQGLERISEQEATYRKRVSEEWHDVRTASDDNEPFKKIDKEMEDWGKATAALNQFMAKAAPMMKELKETADRATQALNNLP